MSVIVFVLFQQQEKGGCSLLFPNRNRKHWLNLFHLQNYEIFFVYRVLVKGKKESAITRNSALAF